MPATYRVEQAKSNRAICTNGDCKKGGIKIEKGELRFGTLVTLPNENTSFKWKHWGCVSPLQLDTWREESQGDTDLWDGYDELPAEMQEKVKRAIEQGHVDDADWKGDPEMNRDGKRGGPKFIDKKSTGDAEDDNAEEDATSTTKPAPKKRGRAKQAEDGNEEGKSAPKKARGRPKKVAADGDKTTLPTRQKAEDHAASDVENSDHEEEAAAPKQAKSRAKKAEHDDDQPASAPTKKAKGRPKKVDTGDDKAVVPPERTSGRTKRAAYKEASDDEDAEAGSEDAPPKKARATRKKAKAAEKDGDDTEEATAPSKSKGGRKKKAAAEDEAKQSVKKGRSTKVKSAAVVDEGDTEDDE